MNWTHDLRFALRMIRKNPWFSAAIVLTLGLGMGVNTTVFSLVNGVLYKPLPFPGGERLVMAAAEDVPHGRDFVDISYADYLDFKRDSKSFEHLEAFTREGMTLIEKGIPTERYRGVRLTAGMFEMLHAMPALGRGFVAADEKAGAEAVALIGHGIWKERYGSDPAIAGRTVRINGTPAVIIGVMPEGFRFPSNEDLWMPAVPDAQLERRGNRRFFMVGIIRAGSSIAEAQADLSVIAHRLLQQYPDTHKDHGARVQTFHEVMNGGEIRQVFLLMLGAVGFVLLIACANVANMLLSRAMVRGREVSIRAALGASRWRITRQLLIESIVLACLGGLLGLLLAQWGIRGFALAVENVGKPYWIDFSMDYAVFGYIAAIIILSGIIFGLAPALRSSRVNLADALKEGARSSDQGHSGFLSGTLVASQFTLAVVLLSGAGLMMRSFLNAKNEFAQLPSERILLARVGLPSGRYPNPDQRLQFFEKLMTRLESLPGAQVLSMTSNVPGGGSYDWRFELDGQAIQEADRRPSAAGVIVSKNYFRALGLPILRGRDFDDIDGLPGKEAVIVSRQFVARHFGDENPLGRRLRFFEDNGKPRPYMTIVGVVPGFRQNNPASSNNDSQVFVPHRFEASSGMTILMRTAGKPPAMAPALRNEVRLLDEELPVANVETLNDFFRRIRWQWGVFGTVFMVFAAVAMGMAAVGIYAVMAHVTTRRTQEIGIRMALGANNGNVILLMIRRGLVQLVVGMALGVGAAVEVCQLMSGLLFKVSPRDPLTFGAVSAILAAVGLIACWMPSRRAARVDPVRALRCD